LGGGGVNGKTTKGTVTVEMKVHGLGSLKRDSRANKRGVCVMDSSGGGDGGKSFEKRGQCWGFGDWAQKLSRDFRCLAEDGVTG